MYNYVLDENKNNNNKRFPVYQEVGLRGLWMLALGYDRVCYGWVRLMKIGVCGIYWVGILC